jgi:hypothetical protein
MCELVLVCRQARSSISLAYSPLMMVSDGSGGEAGMVPKFRLSNDLKFDAKPTSASIAVGGPSVGWFADSKGYSATSQAVVPPASTSFRTRLLISARLNVSISAESARCREQPTLLIWHPQPLLGSATAVGRDGRRDTGWGIMKTANSKGKVK